MNRLLAAPVAALLLASVAVAEPATDAREFVFLGESRPVLVRLRVERDGQSLTATRDACMKYLFGYLDVNGDGSLSAAEAERAPSLELMQRGISTGLGGGRGGPAPTGPKMEEMDVDTDGKVTPAELSAYYAKKGFAPYQFQLEASQADRLLGVAASFGGPKPEPPVDVVARSIFGLLDTGKDGKLTRERLADAPKLLAAKDEDQDEMVTGRELAPESGGDLGDIAALIAMGAGGRQSTATSTRTLVPITTPNEVPADLVKRLQERYARSIGDDEEKAITAASIGLDKAVFGKLDANSDGKLSAEELPAFVKRGPDLAVVLRRNKETTRFEVATDGPSALAGQLWPRDNTALLDLGVTRLDVRGNDDADADPISGIARQQIGGQFRSADVNGDGFVDEAEAGNSRTLKGLFKMLDRTGAGKVSEKDLQGFIDHTRELQQRAADACVTLELTDVSRGLFDLLDTDRDGRLGTREMRRAPELLASFDRAGKGYLTKDDLPHTYRLEVRRGPLSRGGLGGAAAFLRYLAPPSKTEPESAREGPTWMRKMDRNRDGDISRREWLFSDETFRRIDTDRDGLIDPSEAERYESPRRKN